MSDKAEKNQKQTQCWCGFCVASHCRFHRQNTTLQTLQSILPIGFYATPLEFHSPVLTRSKNREREGIQTSKKIYYQSEDEPEQKYQQYMIQNQYKYNRLKAKDQEDKNKNFYPQICGILSDQLQILGANPALYKLQLQNTTKASLLSCFKQPQLSKYFSQIFQSQKLIRQIQLRNALVQNKIKNIKRLNGLKKQFIKPFMAANFQGKQKLQGFGP